uniref:Uncharacterized protein n=1 Tax=Strongyloides papillosus TaxID=174720 RepID=A0A0N5B580_STREA
MKCKTLKNQASIFFSSSITEHDALSFYGLKNATICSSCHDGYLVRFSAYKTNKIVNNSEPIADISCSAGQNLCLCDYHNNCYTPNSKTISVMLYPACIKKRCFIYAILAGYGRNDALISIDNVRFFYSVNQINFKTKQYWPLDTDGVYITVKSIGCNGCNIKECKKRKPNLKKPHHKG